MLQPSPLHVRDPGELRESLQLLRPVTAKGSDGSDRTTYAPVAPAIRGKYLPQRADERLAAAQTRADVFVRFIVRQRDDITSRWRLTWNGAGYDITAATPLPGRQWMELICRLGQEDGQ